MRSTLTIIAFLLLASTGARAQLSGRRGTTAGHGVNSVTAEINASATMLAPVTIRILEWPKDFVSGAIGNSAQDRSKIFSVGGAPDYAIDISVPESATLRSTDANIGTVELTGIHSTKPERSAPEGMVSRYSADLRFGLMATPPTVSDDPSLNERGTYVGSCKVTVNYN